MGVVVLRWIHLKHYLCGAGTCQVFGWMTYHGVRRWLLYAQGIRQYWYPWHGIPNAGPQLSQMALGVVSSRQLELLQLFGRHGGRPTHEPVCSWRARFGMHFGVIVPVYVRHRSCGFAWFFLGDLLAISPLNIIRPSWAQQISAWRLSGCYNQCPWLPIMNPNAAVSLVSVFMHQICASNQCATTSVVTNNYV